MDDLIVKHCDNGYIICYYDEELGKEKKIIFEDQYTEIGDLEAMKNLLWFIKEHFGVFHSKHNKQNLVIEIKGNDDGNDIIH